MSKKEGWKVVGNILFLSIVLFIAIYLMNHSLKKIFIELTHTEPILLSIIFFLGCIYQLMEGKILSKMIRPLNSSFSLLDGFFASCYTSFYRIISFGIGTIPAEISFYHKKGLSYSEGLGITTLRMVLYKLTIFIFALLSLFIHFISSSPVKSSFIPTVFLGCFVTISVVGGLFVLSLNSSIQSWIMFFLNKHVTKSSWRVRIDSFNQSIYALREVIQCITKNKQLVLSIGLLSILKVLSWYSIPIVYFFYEGYSITWYELILMISFTTVVAGVIPAPAGIGSFEFVYLFIFQPVFGTVETISSMFIYRFSTYLLPFFIGFLYVLITKRREITQSIHPTKEEE